MIRRFIQLATDRCRMVLGAAAPVLVYHGTFSRPPADFAQGFHNVRPTVVREQLQTLKRYFRFVSVDELASASSWRGLAALTFDDAYRCVLDEAFPLLADLEIPLTIYVNGCTLDGKVPWRDKVRLLVNRGLVGEFEAVARNVRPIGKMSFYRYSKEAPNHSRDVEAEIDAFLASRGIAVEGANHVVRSADEFLRHPLVSYGNHSHDHYNLATLSAREQREQLDATRQRLAAVPGIQLSESVAIPFGQARHFNDDTLRAAADLGYRSLLLSRNQIVADRQTRGGLALLERFMPDERPMTVIVPRLLGRKAA